MILKKVGQTSFGSYDKKNFKNLDFSKIVYLSLKYQKFLFLSDFYVKSEIFHANIVVQSKITYRTYILSNY